MVVVVSTRAVKASIGKALSANVSFDRWILVKTMPVARQDIVNLLKRYKCDAEKGRLLFFVNMRKKAPADFPGLFVDNWLLSLIFYKNNDELSGWLDALGDYSKNRSRKAYVLGMMKPFYMQWANKLYACLRNEKTLRGNAAAHLPDTTTNGELAKKLSKGCSLALYVGHGRSRGWSGYRGFRWNHMEGTAQSAPVGTLISFSCSGLKSDKKDSVPFGLRWITSGRACTSIAACEALQIKPLEDIVTAFMESISIPGINRVDELLFDINERLRKKNDPDVDVNWRRFRLIGNPLQLIK